MAMLCAILLGMRMAMWTETCRTQRLLWTQATEALAALAEEAEMEAGVMQAGVTPVTAQSRADPGT